MIQFGKCFVTADWMKTLENCTHPSLIILQSRLTESKVYFWSHTLKSGDSVFLIHFNSPLSIVSTNFTTIRSDHLYCLIIVSFPSISYTPQNTQDMTFPLFTATVQSHVFRQFLTISFDFSLISNFWRVS